MFLIFHRSFYTTEALAQRSFYRQTPLHREAFTERDGYTQHFSQRDALTRTSFHMQKLFHTDAVTRTLFHTEAFTVRQVPLHTKASTQKLLRRCCYTATLAFAPGCFHRDAYTQRSFYADQLLGTEPFTHDASTRKLVHREASTQRLSRIFLLTDAFTRSFYREAFTNRSPLLVRQTLLHIEAVAHRSFCKPKPAFYAQKLLRREVLADRCCSHRRSQKLLHTDTFFTQKLLHGEIVTSCSFRRRTPLNYTQKLLHKRSFCAQMQLHADTFPHRGPVTQRSFDTGKLWHTEAFAARRLDTQKLLETWKVFTTTPYKVTRRQKKWLAFPTRTISTEGCAREEQNLSHFITHCLGFCLMTMNVELAVAWFPISRLHAGWGHMAQSAGSERWPTTIENTAQLEKHVVQTETAGTSGKRPFLIS